MQRVFLTHQNVSRRFQTSVFSLELAHSKIARGFCNNCSLAEDQAEAIFTLRRGSAAYVRIIDLHICRELGRFVRSVLARLATDSGARNACGANFESSTDLFRGLQNESMKEVLQATALSGLPQKLGGNWRMVRSGLPGNGHQIRVLSKPHMRGNHRDNKSPHTKIQSYKNSQASKPSRTT